MKLPRVRVSVRGLMLIVALAAAGCWLSERHLRFRRVAEYHEVHSGWVGLSGVHPMMVDHEFNCIEIGESDWHRALARKYWFAAYYPWLPIGDDPPMEVYQRAWEERYTTESRSMQPEHERRVRRIIENFRKSVQAEGQDRQSVPKAE